eukprot:PITA_20960
MSEYDFEISYNKGKENVVANALIRRPRTFSLVALKVNLRERLLEKLFEDCWYIKVISALQGGKQIEPMFEGYVLKPDGLLRFQGRMYIPKEGGFPLTSQRHNVIFVIVDKLTKSSHFILARDIYDVTDVAGVFISEVIRQHGLPTKIIFDRDSRFTSRFWISLQSTLGTQLNLSTAYHLEKDGQTERVNQVMEDMLRMYVMDNQTQWERYLPLVEFAYNNSYHSSIGMPPYQALYGRPCRTSLSWEKLED